MSESEMEVGGNGEASGGAAGAEADLSTQRLLPRGIPGSGSITAMERGGIAKEDVPDQPSDDDTDTDDDEEDGEESEAQHEYKFDPVTEYIIKVGRQNAQLDAAWDFYAHYTLPTYVRREDGNELRPYRLQEPGETGGRLYHLWRTPLKQLGDFGVGMGLYFQTLYVMGVVFLCAGLANTASIVYFRSDSYSGGQDKLNEQISRGSAACTVREVVCLSADCTEWSPDHRPCELELMEGVIDFVTTLVMFISVWVLGAVQNAWAASIDESEQTAGDYSVEVMDPNPHDLRPAIWKRFFERKFGRVRYVTVARQNGNLMRLLQRRFGILENIRLEAQGQEEEDLAKDPEAPMVRTSEDWPMPWWKNILIQLGLATDIVCLHEQLVKVSKEIEEEALTPKMATKVFVTFEKEASQRECLEQMTTGLLCSVANLKPDDELDDGLVRHGNVLNVRKAPEPGDIIWENLEYTIFRRILEFLARLAITAVMVFLAGIVVFWLAKDYPAMAAGFIAVNNAVLPAVIMWLMDNPCGGEHHHTNSRYQASLMFKIVLAQWMNTGFIIYIIQNIHEAPTEDYITQVSAILWADAFTQPLFKVLDLKARFDQYFVAPSEKTQGKMNSHFLGTTVILAERYASTVKTLFVCLFFSAIFPQGYFIAAMAMFMNYWTSKYCLFNRWKTPEPCDDSLTILTRRYLSVAIVIHILVSLQFYAGWPFDGLCPTSRVVTSAFTAEDEIEVTETDSYVLSDRYPQVGDIVYEECEQDTDAVWNEMPKSWMTDDQMVVVFMFCIFGIVTTAVMGFILFGETIYRSFRRLCRGVYNPVGKAGSVGFSEVEQIDAYVPEVREPRRPHSLLATNLRRMNSQHISWTGAYEAYNLCSRDAFPGMRRKERMSLFSTIVYFNPAKDRKMSSLLPVPSSCVISVLMKRIDLTLGREQRAIQWLRGTVRK